MLERFLLKFRSGKDSPLPNPPEYYVNLFTNKAWLPDEYGYGIIDSYGQIRSTDGISQRDIYQGIRIYCENLFRRCGKKPKYSKGLEFCKVDISSGYHMFFHYGQITGVESLKDTYECRVSLSTKGIIKVSSNLTLNYLDVDQLRLIKWPSFDDYRGDYKKDGALVCGGHFNHYRSDDAYSPDEARLKWIGINFILRNLRHLSEPRIIYPEDIYPNYANLPRIPYSARI